MKEILIRMEERSDRRKERKKERKMRIHNQDQDQAPTY